MTSERVRLLRVQEEIRWILLHEWDPIGIREEPGAQDEYDSYVGPICTLLAAGTPPSRIAEHLARIEREMMGLGDPPEDRLPVAMKLCALDVAP